MPDKLKIALVGIVLLSVSGCKLLFGDDFLACIGEGPASYKSAAFAPAIVEVKAGSPAITLTLETVSGCRGFPPRPEDVTLTPQLGTVNFKVFELRYTPPTTVAAPTDVILTLKLDQYRQLTQDPQLDLEPSVTLRIKP